jgi:hypothetical protein
MPHPNGLLILGIALDDNCDGFLQTIIFRKMGGTPVLVAQKKALLMGQQG